MQMVSETMLYRGDSTMINKFDVKKTGFIALFGSGIYLTDNPIVAADYTLKSSNRVIIKEANSLRDLLVKYLALIIKDRFDWKNINQKLLDKFSTAFSRASDEERKQTNQEYRNAQLQIISELMKKAKAVFKKEADNLRIFKNSFNKWSLVHHDRDAYISSFEIPNEYLNRCLNADEPLPDKVIDLIKKLFLNGREETMKFDMRDSNGNFMSFDDWIHAYKTKGIMYAWKDNNQVVKGHGKNPSLDVIRNGTHFGYSWFYDKNEEDKFIKGMMGLGYVGLEYYGGVKVSGHVRGGGGTKHRSFVFWNDDDINSFRVDTKKIEDTGLKAKAVNGIQTATILKSIWDLERNS